MRTQVLEFLELEHEISSCSLCPRLVAWRQKIAIEKRRAYIDEEYWGKPVPGFGDNQAKICIVGLAPSAHGANRTGRMFTGDKSGEWLYRSLYTTGFSNKPRSEHRLDELELRGVYITAPVKCAPPENKPLVEERENCFHFLQQELFLLKHVRVLVALGRYSFTYIQQKFRKEGSSTIPFKHGQEVVLSDGKILLASYHVSQQNTNTGLLTESMLDEIFFRAKELAHLS